mgnify:CR=1 FL=1
MTETEPMYTINLGTGDINDAVKIIEKASTRELVKLINFARYETAAKDQIKAAEDEYKTRNDLINQYNKAWKEDQKRAE